MTGWWWYLAFVPALLAVFGLAWWLRGVENDRTSGPRHTTRQRGRRRARLGAWEHLDEDEQVAVLDALFERPASDHDRPGADA